MADVKVEIFKRGEIFKNITQTINLDGKNLTEFSKALRTVQKSTNGALQQLVESEKGDNGFLEMENEEEDEEIERREEKRRKDDREQKGHRKKIREK